MQSVEQEIVRAVADKLRLQLRGVRQIPVNTAVHDPRAYEAYLNGLLYYRKGDQSDLQRALEFYDRALSLDSRLAFAWAGKSAVYFGLTSLSALNPEQGIAQAEDAALMALRTDSSLAEAHSRLADVERGKWHWSAAQSEYRRAIELSPSLAIAHTALALLLAEIGQSENAIREIRHAQALDPLRPLPKALEGLILMFARRSDEAIRQLVRVTASYPESGTAHVFLGYAYDAKGRFDKAIAEYQKDIQLEGPNTSDDCFLGFAYARSGHRTKALSLVEKVRASKGLCFTLRARSGLRRTRRERTSARGIGASLFRPRPSAAVPSRRPALRFAAG